MPATFAPSPLHSGLICFYSHSVSKTTTAAIIHTRNLCFRAFDLPFELWIFLHTTYLLIFLIIIRDIT